MESNRVISKVLFYQLYLIIFLGIILALIYPSELLSFLIGGAFSAVNFGINIYYSKKMLSKQEFTYPKYIVGFILRIFVGVLGGLLVFKISVFGVLVYFLGYLTHSLAIFIYGVKLK